MIPKSVIKIVGQEGISGIYIQTDLSQCQNIANFICQLFDENWEKACFETKKRYGECFEYINAWPSGIDAYPWNDGLFLTFPALYTSYDHGTKCDNKFGIEALENTLRIIADKFPEIYYYGVVAFVDSTNHMTQKKFCSQGKKLPEKLEFMWNVIEYINQNVDSFIDCVKGNCYEFEAEDSEGKWVEKLIDFLHIYEDKIDFSIYDKILSTTCEYIGDDDLYDKLEEKIEAWKKAAGYV